MLPMVLLFTILTLAAWFAIPRLPHGLVNITLAVSVLNLLVAVPELVLRLRDFRYEAGIQFGYPRPSQFVYLQPDSQLFWRRSRADRAVNSLGFVGPEVRLPKPQGHKRILFFGDSVTEQGFPDVVGHLLNLAHSPGSIRYECVSLATAGYSSYQGKVLVDMYGASLEPDVAVVFFGWNDHYRAYGAPDATKRVNAASPAGGVTGRVYHHARVVQLAAYAWDTLRGSTPQPLDVLRVPPDAYRDNLVYMHEQLGKRDVPVVFITAPTSHYAVRVPDYLVGREFAVDTQTLLHLHRQYNGIVREVARDTESTLLDLESEFESLPPRDVGALFSRDGIHLSLAGVAVVASRIAAVVTEVMAGQPPSGVQAG
jgi:lysophospholipase L1-like esterase